MEVATASTRFGGEAAAGAPARAAHRAIRVSGSRLLVRRVRQRLERGDVFRRAGRAEECRSEQLRPGDDELDRCSVEADAEIVVHERDDRQRRERRSNLVRALRRYDDRKLAWCRPTVGIRRRVAPPVGSRAVRESARASLSRSRRRPDRGDDPRLQLGPDAANLAEPLSRCPESSTISTNLPAKSMQATERGELRLHCLPQLLELGNPDPSRRVPEPRSMPGPIPRRLLARPSRTSSATGSPARSNELRRSPKRAHRVRVRTGESSRTAYSLREAESVSLLGPLSRK